MTINVSFIASQNFIGKYTEVDNLQVNQTSKPRKLSRVSNSSKENEFEDQDEHITEKGTSKELK